MRLIGYLDNERRARAFGDYMYVEGIENEVEPEAEGRWAIWIRAEEQVERARLMMQEFQAQPDDPRYYQSGAGARQLRAQEKQAIDSADRRFYDRKRLFPEATRIQLGGVTVVLIAICVIVFCLQQTADMGPVVTRALRISNFYNQALLEIRQGEVWRLLTPAIMHGSFLHLLFNMLWLKDLGSLIESRQGWLTFLLLAVAFAAFSNFGQYLIAGPRFLGMSGVIYGLFGYVWMRGRLDPRSGLFMDPNTVVFMLIWFVLCFTPLMGNIANTAHAVGLGAGVAWGAITGYFRR